MTTLRDDSRAPAEKTAWHKPLGDLEQAIMEVVWDHAAIGSPEVQAALAPARRLALTTVVTVLDRLHTKGLLSRERVGKGYQYTAAISRPDLEERIVRGVLEELMTDFPDALTSLLQGEAGLDAATQDRLTNWLHRQQRGEENNA